MRRLLTFNPLQRITVEDALKHPYVAPFHNEGNEQTTNPIIIPMNDNKKFSIKEYRDALYSEINKRNGLVPDPPEERRRTASVSSKTAIPPQPQPATKKQVTQPAESPMVRPASDSLKDNKENKSKNELLAGQINPPIHQGNCAPNSSSFNN